MRIQVRVLFVTVRPLSDGGGRPRVYEASSNCIMVTGITTTCGGIDYLPAIYSIVGLHC